MRVFGRGHWLNLRLTLRNSGQIFVWRRRVRWLAGSGLRRTGSDSAGFAAGPGSGDVLAAAAVASVPGPHPPPQLVQWSTPFVPSGVVVGVQEPGRGLLIIPSSGRRPCPCSTHPHPSSPPSSKTPGSTRPRLQRRHIWPRYRDRTPDAYRFDFRTFFQWASHLASALDRREFGM